MFFCGRVIAFRNKKREVIWLFTDLPSSCLSAEAAKRLFRVRWQIELLFKRLKSQLDLKDLPTRKGPTARSWLLLKFLAAAVAQQMLIPVEPFPPEQAPSGETGYTVSSWSRFRMTLWTPRVAALYCGPLLVLNDENEYRRLKTREEGEKPL